MFAPGRPAARDQNLARRQAAHAPAERQHRGVARQVTPAGLLSLQRLAGNVAVTRLLAGNQPMPVPAQRSAVHGVLRTAGRPLDATVRDEMESRLGTDFSDVRVHTDAAAHASADSVNAHAFTSGSHIVFQRGRYDVSSPAGKQLLAHELTHVIQQRSGPVAGTDTGDGLRVSDPADRFEREAAATAARVMSGPARERRTPAENRSSGQPGQPVQRDIAVQRQYTGTHSTNWGPLRNECGTSMDAELHPKQLAQGSRPSVKPSWWPTGTGPTATWFSTYMVQGHLLNENVGGPGNTQKNLTPLTKAGNSKHHSMAEKNVKDELLKNGNIVEYHVTPAYNTVSGAKLAGASAPPTVAADIDANYAGKIPTTVNCDVAVYDPQGTWKYGEGWVVHNEKDY